MFLEALETQRLRSMPNSTLPPTQNTHAGVILVGDSMNMRHPLTGGGMTVALNDAVLLADLLRRDVVPTFAESSHLLDALATFHWRRKVRHASVINLLASALYTLFAAGSDPQLRLLRDATFSYFLRGGACQDGPMAFLSGLDANVAHLAYHFVSVAVLGCLQQFRQVNPLMALWRTVLVWKTIVTFVAPLVYGEITRT